MKAKTFNTSILLLVFLPFFAVGLFNYFINPFRFFEVPGISGINLIGYSHNFRIIKPHQVSGGQYDAIIIGSSRGMQIREQHAAWNTYNAYNFSIPAIKIEELLRYVQHAHGIHPLKKVLIGLDFLSFSNTNKPDLAAAEPRLSLLRSGEPNPNFSRWADYARVLFTKDALDEAIESYQRNKNNHRNKTYEQKNEEVLLEKVGGHFGRFKTVDGGAMNSDSSWLNHKTGVGAQKKVAEQLEKSGESFNQLLVFARENNIELVIFTSPIHARLHAALYAVGLFEMYQQWKRTIAGVVQQNARDYGAPAYPVWDYGVLDEYSMERVPSEQETALRMKYYIEGSHFTEHYGDLIQDKILLGEQQQMQVERLDQLIKNKQLENHLAKQKDYLKQYIQQHPIEWEVIKTQAEAKGTLFIEN